MSQNTIGRVEDYTDAFLTTLGVFLFVAFWVIAAAFGYIWLAVTAYGLDHLFKWIGRIRSD
jgi:threonine/homoserine/homoserine lactone efflux protein